MFINPAFAQAADVAGEPSAMMGLLFQFGLIFLVFYYFLIRPQRKQYMEHEEMLKAITRGDRIITGGGIHAKVVKVEGDDDLVVDLADEVRVKIRRSTVRDVLDKKASAKDKAKKNGDKKADKGEKDEKGAQKRDALKDALSKED